MQKSLLFLSIFVCIFFSVAAQDLNKTTAIKFDKAENVPASNPLVIVDDVETDMQSLVLSPDNIKEINVFKDSAAIRLYGLNATGGVIVIKTKPGTSFQKFNDFVDTKKGINTSVKQFKLNGKLLPDMKKILIDSKALTSTMISSDWKLDEKNCVANFNDTLVITTRFTDKE